MLFASRLVGLGAAIQAERSVRAPLGTCASLAPNLMPLCTNRLFVANGGCVDPSSRGMTSVWMEFGCLRWPLLVGGAALNCCQIECCNGYGYAYSPASGPNEAVKCLNSRGRAASRFAVSKGLLRLQFASLEPNV